MAASSLTNLSLSLHQYSSKTPKFPNLIPYKNPKFHSSSSISIHTKLRQPIRKPYFSSTPFSKYSIAAFLSPPPEKISKIFVKTFVAVLLGSLVFIGFSKSRPVVAEPVRESVVLEENDSQSEQSRGKEEEEDEEEIMCVKLLQQNPESIEALKMVVNVKMKKGKPGESMEYVAKLIELQPNEMEWRLLEALCCEMTGDLSKAKSLFKEILKQSPLLLKALHGLAMVMHKKKEGPAVFAMLDKALEIARREKRVNEERNIRILIAQMHTIKGNFEEALENFQDLIEENPRDFRPYLCQGLVYSLLEKTEEAEENFEIYRSLVPDEFPQRGFLDDVVLAAKIDSKQQLEKQP
ncbi:Tetratricopeptide repeat (TPR)-like superfamily protein [Striga hermonthica]|uniref:Tetratricopeptide repeat (TPR)-like superfamily protein n=1 Tax=Striga hermonthica TaxID=68872 RepID=A0A9N7RS32_STRHE|nr:Tetratricopeptide repeat (TPR)-like superfamily protein [Striga hermonthica]